MYLCAQLEENVCILWVEYNSIFTLPEGSGLKIGGMLLLLSATAWGIRQTASFLLNR